MNYRFVLTSIKNTTSRIVHSDHSQPANNNQREGQLYIINYYKTEYPAKLMRIIARLNQNEDYHTTHTNTAVTDAIVLH